MAGTRKRPRSAIFLVFSLVRGTFSEKAHPIGCSQKPPSYYDYENFPFPPPSLPVQSLDDYLLTRRLGTGKFSDVFEAVDVQAQQPLPGNNKNPAVVDPRTLVVVKCLKPVSERKIRREILVLERVRHLPNLARLLAVVISPEYYASHREQPTDLPRMPALVLQHAGPNAQWLCHGVVMSDNRPPQKSNGSPSDDSTFLTDDEIRYYLYHLLTALDGLHASGIMHRDVKARNVLINRRGRALHAPLMLIDLGLADFYLPNTVYNVRVASRHYKAPELLLGYPYYDYAIDLWGVGCILAGLLFRREPFFRGRDNVDQLGKIVAVLGTDDLMAFVKKYQVQLSPEIQQELSKYSTPPISSTTDSPYCQRQNWLSITRTNDAIVSRDALDLLDHLLVYDHEERWTAQQAMRHKYFDIVRERVQAEVRSYRPTVRSTAASTMTSSTTS